MKLSSVSRGMVSASSIRTKLRSQRYILMTPGELSQTRSKQPPPPISPASNLLPYIGNLAVVRIKPERPLLRRRHHVAPRSPTTDRPDDASIGEQPRTLREPPAPPRHGKEDGGGHESFHTYSCLLCQQEVLTHCVCNPEPGPMPAAALRWAVLRCLALCIKCIIVQDSLPTLFENPVLYIPSSYADTEEARSHTTAVAAVTPAVDNGEYDVRIMLLAMNLATLCRR